MKNEKRVLTLAATLLLGASVVAGIGEQSGVALLLLLGWAATIGARIQTGRLARRVDTALDGVRFAGSRS